MTKRQLLNKLAWIAGFALVFFALLTVRFHLQSREFFRRGEAALAQGEAQLAAAYYDQAIRAHSIFAAPGRDAARRLEQIAGDFERRGDWQNAAHVRQTLLSALSAIDTGWSPARRKRIRQLQAGLEQQRREQAGRGAAAPQPTAD